MKRLFNLLISLMNMIPIIINLFPRQEGYNFKSLARKTISYAISFVFLVSAYVFGCIALYSYLLPYWGAPLSALFLCLFGLILSLGLILGNRLVKAKKSKPSPNLIEQALGEVPNFQDLSKILMKTSPKVLLTVMGAVALTAYMVILRKRK